MKIIDLLQRIANCEEVPKKIKYCDRIWTYFEEQADYTNDFERLFNYYINEEITTSLNDEVEIIEERPTMNDLRERCGLPRIEDKKIENIKVKSNFTYNQKQIARKINEIIEVINNDRNN